MLAERLLHYVGVHGSGFSAPQAHEWAQCLLGCMHRRFCATRGHDLMLQFEPDRVSLRCVDCGWESAGWTIDRPLFSCTDELINADARSARPLDRLERRSVEQAVRGEDARVAKHEASSREVERVPSEIGHTSTGLLDQ